ncbi:MAG: AAA family ATPase [Sedimentisphaerales bacterium]|nr:AAA family ATPase [Sedimentisphaerales bacterium]
MEKLLNSLLLYEAPIGNVVMIKKLSISNFKSVRQLDIDCKKVNLFIGEPNTGKSNILEAIGLLSWSARVIGGDLTDYVRFQTTPDIFYDRLLDNAIKISVTGEPTAGVQISFEDDKFLFQGESGPGPFGNMNYDGRFSGGIYKKALRIKFFRFKYAGGHDDKEAGGLKPPNGKNLFSVVYSSNELRETMIEFFRKYKLRLVLKPQERKFELQKQTGDLVFSFPYALTSDTLQRIIFYTVSIASNKDSVLVFEEPESNAFPYYTKYLGERIALDQTNQFFIATHNPYLLSAIIEKTRKEDVQVFITYFKDFQTWVKPLMPDQVTELMEADPFFNMDRFIEEEE